MKLQRILAVIFTLSLISACSSSSNSGSTVPPTNPIEPAAVAKVQVVHASSNAPAVNITAGGAIVFDNLDYKESRVPISLDEGTTVDLTVDAILPDGTTATVLDLPGQTF